MMADVLKNPITLAGELLLLRPFDENDAADEIIRQAAIQLRKQAENIEELKLQIKALHGSKQ